MQPAWLHGRRRAHRRRQPQRDQARQKAPCSSSGSNQPQKAADVLQSARDRRRVSLFGDRLHVVADDDIESSDRDIAEISNAAGVERDRRFASSVSRSRTCSSAPSSAPGNGAGSGAA